LKGKGKELGIKGIFFGLTNGVFEVPTRRVYFKDYGQGASI